jgi:hypothetical protein
VVENICGRKAYFLGIGNGEIGEFIAEAASVIPTKEIKMVAKPKRPVLAGKR